MSRLRSLLVASVIVSMVGAPAIAAAPVSAPAATAAGSWSTLSVMTGSSAATAAIRSDDDREDGFGHPALLSLAIILATIAAAIYIITRDKGKDLDFEPLSPN